MVSRTGQAIVEQARFDDFEAYESVVKGWSCPVRKLDTAPFSAHLAQVSVGPIRMTCTELDTSIAVSGAAQAGLASFGIPLPCSPPAMWCRQEASSRAVSVFDSSGAFEAVTRPGFETVVFSIEPEHLNEMAESLGYDTPRRIFASAEVTRGDPEHMRALHRLLHQIRSQLARDSSLLQRPGLRESLEFEVPRRCSAHWPRRLPSRARSSHTCASGRFAEPSTTSRRRPPPGGGGTSHRHRAASVRDLQQLAIRRASR